MSERQNESVVEWLEIDLGKLSTIERVGLVNEIMDTLTAPSRDWNVFKQIFADHWETFRQAQPRYQTAYYADLVAKMLACGNPKRMGYVEYRCLHCGQGTHVVSKS